MREEQLDQVFAALASPVRRRVLDLLLAEPGMSVKALAAHFEMSRVAVLKHVRVLEAAELVLSHKDGRVRRLYMNSVPIQLIHDRWSSQYGRFWSERLVDIRARVEARAGQREKKKEPRRA